MFKKFINWLFGKSCCAPKTDVQTFDKGTVEFIKVEVPAPVVQEEPAAEAPAPRKPKKKYYKKKKPSNT